MIVTFKSSMRPLCSRIGEQVEQALRRVLVPAVARIDNMAIHITRREFGRAALRVANDEAVHAHGLHGQDGVFQRLAFGDTRSRNCQAAGISAEDFGRCLERSARSSTRFKEKRANGFAAQCRNLAYRARQHFLEIGRRIENEIHLVGVHFLQAQNVFAL
jgi:hypothetical protein